MFTALVLWCMVVASAATLGQHHRQVASAAEAARVLRPLAGPAAADLFALGLVASALVASPVVLARRSAWCCWFASPAAVSSQGFAGIIRAEYPNSTTACHSR